MYLSTDQVVESDIEHFQVEVVDGRQDVAAGKRLGFVDGVGTGKADEVAIPRIHDALDRDEPITTKSRWRKGDAQPLVNEKRKAM